VIDAESAIFDKVASPKAIPAAPATVSLWIRRQISRAWCLLKRITPLMKALWTLLTESTTRPCCIALISIPIRSAAPSGNVRRSWSWSIQKCKILDLSEFSAIK